MHKSRSCNVSLPAMSLSSRSSAALAGRSATATRTLLRIRASVMARPSPRAPPVTMTALFAGSDAFGGKIRSYQLLDTEVSRLRLRISRKLGGAASMHDTALAHDKDHVRVPQRKGKLLLDEKDRCARLLERRNGTAELAHHHRRQSLGRLVHQQQRRISDQRARCREHLLLAAAELAGKAAQPAVKIGKEIDDPGKVPLAPPARGHLQMLLHG